MLNLPRLRLACQPKEWTFQVRSKASPFRAGGEDWSTLARLPLDPDALQEWLETFHAACTGSPFLPYRSPLAAAQRLQVHLRKLLPTSVLEWLDAQPTIHLQSPESQLPWELVTQGQVVRHLNSSPEVDNRCAARFLVVANPDGTLPWSEQEALHWTPNCPVDVLSGAAASWDALAHRLETGSYQMLWLNANMRKQGSLRRSHLWLADGPCSSAELAKRLPVLPALVLLQPVALEADQQPYPCQQVQEWADEFARLGAQAVIAPSWERPGLEEVYRELLHLLLEGQELLSAWPIARPKDGCLRLWASSNLRLTAHSVAATAPSRLRPNYQVAVLSGADSGRVLPMLLKPGGSVSLGREGMHSNEIVLHDERLPNRAALLELDGDTVFLTNLSHEAALVQVNELPLLGRIAVQPGDHLRLGSTTLRFEAFTGWERAAEKVDHCLRLLTEAGELVRQVALEANVTSVGRLPDCGLCLDNSAVSRLHLSITRRNQAFYLTPLGSNPTLVNGVQQLEERELEPGDVIVICEGLEIHFLELTPG